MNGSSFSLETTDVRHPFSRVRVQVERMSKSLTHQSFKAESDINTVLKRYQQGVVPRTNPAGHYDDVSGYADSYQVLIDRSNDNLDLYYEWLAKSEASKTVSNADSQNPPAQPSTESAEPTNVPSAPPTGGGGLALM